MALIFCGSSIPGQEADTMTRTASGVDEPVQVQRIKDAVHVVEYGLLTVLLIRSFRKGADTASAGHAVKSAVIATMYGISDEAHQLFVPLRNANIGDVLRNAVGVALGMGIVMGIEWAKRRNQRGRASRGFDLP